MIKVVAVLNAKPGISREEFLHKWNVEHPVLVRKLPGLRRYRQNPAIEHREQWPFDGMAELWFASVADVKAAYAGEEAKRLFEHEEQFLERIQWFLADEVEIDLND
ncbi:EthD family reductase [Sinomonas sp. G460-2]|uniref:EthD family reductase n=1 Tax=Sinomonas sp. G460-2 TaxID=3393464 RepID=UPI0039EF87B6